MVTIGLCETKSEWNKFETVAESLHRNNPNFVPPFPGSVSKIFGAKTPYAAYCTFAPFIAHRNGVPVGRILACENRAHNAYYQDRTGFFGFFDCIDDASVAKELFDKARGWLQARGLTTIRGPYSPTVNDECGLLVEGFDLPPFVMMPYNPPYYKKLVLSAGLSTVRELEAYYCPADSKFERLHKIADRVQRSTGITLRNLRLNDLDNEIVILHQLYNSTLDRNWGFVPISLADLQFAAKDLKAILDPSLVIIAEKDGRPIGFCMTIPNINESLAKVRKLPRWLRPLAFLLHFKTHFPKAGRQAILGVLPEFRGKGLGPLFYVESVRRVQGRFVGGELSWIEANNDEIIKGVTMLGAAPYKKYEIFEGPVAGYV